MNILHLSDIHFGRNYLEYGIHDDFDNKEEILDELIECISNIEEGWRPEHIVVTGDVAWRGKQKDFEEAYVWFSKLLTATGLEGKDITFCVGNHDVNRAYACANRDLKDNDISRIDDIFDYNHVHEMEPPIYEYDKFCEKIGMEPFMYPLEGAMEYSYSLGYKDVTFPSGNVIRLFAFNTALLSCLPNIDDDRMWIGQKQINSLLSHGILPAKDVHYSIALFHHAERFLHPNEICEYDGRIATLPLLRDYVDLVLCGHTETGGRPVLQQQMGGGKVLTGGASYYSDNHPNAFSMIYIPDNEKNMCFQPYTYDGSWKKYEYGDNKVDIQPIHELPKLGELQESCRLIVSDENLKYEIPLKKVSVFSYEKDGKQFLCLNNKKEVLRELDIECEAAITGENPKFNVTLAPKMERSVGAMLKREEYFVYLSKIFQGEGNSQFAVKSESGEDVFSGSNISGTIEADEWGTELLRKIARIEEFYDVKFYRPDDLYEGDLKKVDTLIKFIEEGYTTEFQLGKTMTTGFCELDEMRKWHKQAEKLNNFCLVYEKPFFCELFGVKFSLGKIMVIAGIYHIDKEDLEYKIETFRDGDIRKCLLKADEEFMTYFISDKDLAKTKVIIKSDYEIFSVKDMGIKMDYIYEE